MNFSPQLITLAHYLAGEFDNQSQALAQPAWYVHLRLWLRPVPIFREDSITLFAEQANALNLNLPYRPRILRLRQREKIEIDFYMLEDLNMAQGAGQNQDLIKQIVPEKLIFLPNCTLTVTSKQLANGQYRFATTPTKDLPCSFTYQEKTFQVFLGFTVTENELLTYDKGIDPATGKGIWGALMGAYQYRKVQDFAKELS